MIIPGMGAEVASTYALAKAPVKEFQAASPLFCLIQLCIWLSWLPFPASLGIFPNFTFIPVIII